MASLSVFETTHFQYLSEGTRCFVKKVQTKKLKFARFMISLFIGDTYLYFVRSGLVTLYSLLYCQTVQTSFSHLFH